MSADDKKPGIGFWTAIAAVILLAYPLSLGPACWLSSRTGSGAPLVSVLYRPLIQATDASPRPVLEFVHWYSEFGAGPNWHWVSSKTWTYIMIY